MNEHLYAMLLECLVRCNIIANSQLLMRPKKCSMIVTSKYVNARKRTRSEACLRMCDSPKVTYSRMGGSEAREARDLCSDGVHGFPK